MSVQFLGANLAQIVEFVGNNITSIKIDKDDDCSQNVLTINGPQFIGGNSMNVGDYIHKDVDGCFHIVKEEEAGTIDSIPVVCVDWEDRYGEMRRK
jgi:hypothetical protein